MTYFIYARDGTSQIVLKRDNEDAALKKARELKEIGWFEVEIRRDRKPAVADEPLSLKLYTCLRCHMSDTAHYRFQSDQARRLARQVTDASVREKLLEMAEEYGRYADLIEARASEPRARNSRCGELISSNNSPDLPRGRSSPGNQGPAPRFSPHENSGRKLQPDFAGHGYGGQRRDRRRRHPARPRSRIARQGQETGLCR